MKIVKPCEVRYLYKYRAVNNRNIERMFRDNEIYMCDPNSFNDPFDCRPSITFHKSQFKREKYFREVLKKRNPDAKRGQLKKLVRTSLVNKKLNTPGHLEDIYKGFVSEFGIYCLSEIADDILMWSHYSESHKGFCVQFKADVTLSLFWETFKVRYQEDFPVINIMEMGKGVEFINALATKSTHWEYEQERRIIKTHNEGGPGFYKFPPELLTGVVIGAMMPDENEKYICQLAADHSTPVKVYKANLSKTHYRVEIDGLNC
jgi:hypothetical protein